MRVNIYIRKEDEEAWDSISNKPEWLSQHLQADIKNPEFIMRKERNKASRLGHYKPDYTSVLAPALYEKLRGECKNGHLLDKFGKCTTKGCKYA